MYNIIIYGANILFFFGSDKFLSLEMSDLPEIMAGGNKKNAATQHEQRHPKPMYN